MIQFEGRKYYLDKSTGYFRSHMRLPDREYLHRAVWRHNYGNIPHGWEVHHKVCDLGTTSVIDLECVPFRQHLSVHEETRRANGRATVHHTRRLRKFICEGCGIAYWAVKKPINRWCSKQCANRFHNARAARCRACAISSPA